MNQSKSNQNQVCRLLKSKNSFGMLESGDSWRGIEDPNATFWCIKTAGVVGPDNGLVSAKTCTLGRKCFRE